MQAHVSNSSGDALFTTTSGHSLVDGDVVYVKCLIENYNGFWYVDQQSATTFKIKQNSASDAVLFIQSASVTFFVCDPVDWSCVHLPIIYELESDLFPTNNVDTARTVSSYTNDSGLVNLNLSGSLGTFEELSFIKISGAGTDSGNGIFQVLDKISASDITIDLAYDSYDFSTASVILYYNNYHISVEVYTGIDSDHAYADQKPYELAATLKFIPDSSNRIRFSINEILKGYIKIKNNLTLGTLPNNIDAWCNYYIKYYESYDESNGYTIVTTQGDTKTDSFNGFASNSMLIFKNIYSGHLSEYVMKFGISGKFLTLFAIPVLFYCEDVDNYQDICAIIEVTDSLQLPQLSQFSNQTTTGNSWTEGAEPEVTLSASTTSDLLVAAINGMGPGDYNTTIYITVDQATTTSQISISYNQTVGGAVGVGFVTPLSAGSNVLSFSGTTVTSDVFEIRFSVVNNEATSRNFKLTGYTVTNQANSQSLYFRKIFLIDGEEQETVDQSLDFTEEGVYRIPTENNVCSSLYDQMKAYVYYTDGFYQEENIISEIKTFSLNCECCDYNIKICWLNNLGGFDWWVFKSGKDHITEIGDTGEFKSNLLPTWPKSYGEFADTINKQSFRESRKQMRVRSQFVSLENLEAISYIKSSPLVQIVTSRTDRRTVIVDTESFTRYREFEDKMYSIEFTVTFTDDIPSQRV